MNKRERWLNLILGDKPNTVVCERHFPTDSEILNIRGELRHKIYPRCLIICHKLYFTEYSTKTKKYK